MMIIAVLAGSFLILVVLAVLAWILTSMFFAWIDVAAQFLEGSHLDFLWGLDTCVAQGQCEAGDSLAHVAVEHFGYYFIKLYGEVALYAFMWLLSFWGAFRAMPGLVGTIIYCKIFPPKSPSPASA